MKARSDDNRVRPCVACDQLIPFTELRCSFCGVPQVAQERPSGKTCSSCSSSIPKRAVYCPNCNILTFTTTSMPAPRSDQESDPQARGKRSITAVWALVLLVLLVQVGLIVDFFFLP